MNETTYQSDTPAIYTPMSTTQLIQVAVFGLLTGLIIWGLTYALENYILRSLLCQQNQIVSCGTVAQYSEAIATILGGAAGLFALVKLQVFRPLLVVLAAMIGLWGLVGILGEHAWYITALSCGALYMLVYLLFTWLTRLRIFWIVIVLLLILVVAIRLILTI